jgi:hypothetical protein
MRRSLLVLLTCLIGALSGLLPSSTAQAQTSSHTHYLPIVARASEPQGLIITPAELRNTKALADTGHESIAKGVRLVLRDAKDGLAFKPCAVANYTSSAAECLNQSSRYALVLMLAYHMTNDNTYAQHAATLIRSWSTKLTSIDNDDRQTRLDVSRWVPAMIWAADLLEGTPNWTAADRQAFQSMLVKHMLPKGQQAAERPNNWGDAGNVLRLSIALYANLPNERAAAIADWKAKLEAMLPDGTLPEENSRGSSALGYNQVALSSKTVFAELLRRRGDDSLYRYRTSRGVGLQDGWNFLAVQVVAAKNGQCIWPHTPNKCVDYSNKSGWELAYAYWGDPKLFGPISLTRPYGWSNWADPGYSTVLFGRP